MPHQPSSKIFACGMPFVERSCLVRRRLEASLSSHRRQILMRPVRRTYQPDAETRNKIYFNHVKSLAEQPLNVAYAKQRGAILHNSSHTCQPLRLLQADNHLEPENVTNSWILPKVAVQNAKSYFDQGHSHTGLYRYSYGLKPLKKSGVLYHLTLSFRRDANKTFRVRQKIACIIDTRPNAFDDRNSSMRRTEFNVNFTAVWLTPRGGVSLSSRDLDTAAHRIAENSKDLFKPMIDATSAFLDALLGLRSNPSFSFTDPCLGLLETYDTQEQPWRAQDARVFVQDKLHGSFHSHIQGQHLGRLYQRGLASHRAIIAFGSNIGDRAKAIEASLLAMMRRGMTVKATSFLYETNAMYYEEQDKFLNGVCEVETSLEPLALLDALQEIENELGRVRLIDKGPRTIDLDILLYDFSTFNDARLQIPHKLMLERDFVLRPLADIIPGERLPPPHNKSSVRRYLEIVNYGINGPQPSILSMLSARLPMLKPKDPTRSTQVMAILNMTPDSFSDGGKHDPVQLESVEATIREFIANGATIIDVGGQSTRPGAPKISPEEELERVGPVIRRIRSMPEARNIAVSVDTFYADVAKGAIDAGADIINDVSAGILDPQMLPLGAELQTTIVLMHMRGTPDTMKDLTDYPDGVVEGVAEELLGRVKDALRAGIPRWRIVLDPGIGFAKTQMQNLELLRNLDTLRQYPGLENFPWLVGTSRKGFIGRITGIATPEERGWGTAATVTASVAGGGDIVRVHDVAEMIQVTKMADAMYRVAPEPDYIENKNGAVETSELDSELSDDKKAQVPTSDTNSSSWLLSSQFSATVQTAQQIFKESLMPQGLDSTGEPLHRSMPTTGELIALERQQKVRARGQQKHRG